MKRIIGALIGLIAGYLAGAGAGAVLVQLLSTNSHDKSVELAMTALLVTGPIGALIGLVIGLVAAGKRPA
jgi:hypothetical protein